LPLLSKERSDKFSNNLMFNHKFASQKEIMIDREDIKERRSNHFRTSMDIGMGIFYMAIGSILLYKHSFGNMEIPAWVAYILGTMMAVGGGFRFYRGLKVILPKKNPDR
jgi:hypothetical protein